VKSQAVLEMLIKMKKKARSNTVLRNSLVGHIALLSH